MGQLEIVAPRKVQNRKLALQLDSLSISRPRRFFFDFEHTQVDVLPFGFNLRSPEIVLFTKNDTDVSAGVVSRSPLVVLALRWVGRAQVQSAVVKRVVVDVVNELTCISAHNFTVHINHNQTTTPAFNSLSVITPSVFAPRGLPKMFRKRGVLSKIDPRDLFLRERDKPNSLIGGLSNHGASNTAAVTAFSRSAFSLPTFRTVVEFVWTLLSVRFARISLRLNSLFAQVHFSPPRETCGLAALTTL